MCLAIYKPKGSIVKPEWLENGFDNNSDGAGFAYHDEGKVVIEKGLFTFEAFMAAYLPHEHQACLIHFRLATHGSKGIENCHPFALKSKGGRMAVVHNGILNIQSDKERSDTANFVSLILQPLVEKFPIDHPVLRYLIEQAIGSSNKIAVMKPDGSHVIFNADKGIWINDVWFSNTGFQDKWSWSPSSRYDPWPCEQSEDDAIAEYLEQGFSLREAEQLVARDMEFALDEEFDAKAMGGLGR